MKYYNLPILHIYIHIYGFLYGFLYVSSGSRISILCPSRSTTVVLNDHEAMMQFTQAAVHLAKDWPFSGGGVVLLLFGKLTVCCRKSLL